MEIYKISKDVKVSALSTLMALSIVNPQAKKDSLQPFSSEARYGFSCVKVPLEQAKVSNPLAWANVKSSYTSIASEFSRKVKDWKDAIIRQSSATKWYLNPAYQGIIVLGKREPQTVIPLVFNQLKNEPDYWFTALIAITNEDAAKGINNFELARTAWLKWGKEHNYIS